MPRIDIELTSARPDGTWTWRAAGARQPKGVLSAGVLHEGAKVGDVVKAEADFDLDGINVTSVLAPKVKKKAGPELLPLLGSGKEEALVTHSPLKPEREGGDRGRRGDRGDRFGGDRFGGGRGGPGGRPGGPGSTRPRATPGPGGAPRDGARREGAAGAGGPGSRERARPDRPERPRGERPPGDRPSRDRPAGDRPSGDRPSGDRPRGERERGPARDRPARERPPRDRPARTPAAGPPARPRPQAKRLQPGRTHREAVLAALAPEQRAIAEQVLRGGLAGVRQAVDEQNAKARAAGAPEIRSDAILRLAEELLPGLRAAEWRDRAEAAAASVDEISLRDLRTVVAGADAAGRDEESRALATTLREGLERRSAAERQAWVDEITTCLTEGRVVRALRVSSRPPEQGLRLPPELGTRLSEAAGEAMAPDTVPDRWLAVLEAVLTSPVRRTMTPKGLPSGADDATFKAARQAIQKVPALGPLLGESPSTRPVPPPPPRRPPAPATPRTPAAEAASPTSPQAAAPAAVPAPPAETAEPVPAAEAEAPGTDSAPSAEPPPPAQAQPAPAAEAAPEPAGGPLATPPAEPATVTDVAAAEPELPTAEAPAPAADPEPAEPHTEREQGPEDYPA